MRLTYSTWGMPMVPIADALAGIALLGYDGVEIAVTKSRDFSTELSKLDAAERRRRPGDDRGGVEGDRHPVDLTVAARGRADRGAPPLTL